MAIFNSALYAQSTGQASTGVGAATPLATYADGQHNGGTRRAILVAFNAALQNLAIGSVINLAVLPQNVTVVGLRIVSDTGTASATVQVGISGTAGYFSGAVSLGTAGNLGDEFTNTANFGTATTAPTTVIATIAGAALTTGNLYFLIEYLSN